MWNPVVQLSWPDWAVKSGLGLDGLDLGSFYSESTKVKEPFFIRLVDLSLLCTNFLDLGPWHLSDLRHDCLELGQPGLVLGMSGLQGVTCHTYHWILSLIYLVQRDSLDLKRSLSVTWLRIRSRLWEQFEAVSRMRTYRRGPGWPWAGGLLGRQWSCSSPTFEEDPLRGADQDQINTQLIPMVRETRF